MKKKKRFIWILGSLIILCAIGGVIFHFTFNTEYWVQRQARKYVVSRPDLSEQYRKAILEGRILVGMFPDEAVAAGGPFVYIIKANDSTMTSCADIRYYFGYQANPPSHPRIPPDMLWRQRNNPDGTQIQLNFNNKTQFDTGTPTGFKVVFQNGRVASIEKMANDG